MLGLTLVGRPRLVAPEAIFDAVGDRRAVLPPAYVELMSLWGPGLLCGVVELPEPASARFRYLQNRMRVDGGARRAAGAWGALTDEAARDGIVLGVDRRGCAYFARGAKDVVVLHPNGSLLPLGTFEDLVTEFLLANRIVATQSVFFTAHEVTAWSWSRRRGERYRADHDLGVPALYVTEPSPRAELYAAWRTGDEAAADAALGRVLEREVTGWALQDLMVHLAGAEDISNEVRATYVDQLYRTANRRIPDLVPDLPIREIRIALGRGELAAEHRAQIIAMIDPPAGIFTGELDATEAALLEQIAKAPDDEAARLVYADHLEARGALDRAESLRADDASSTPLADAAKRGLIAPSYLPPVDGAGRIRARTEAWAREAPQFSLEPVLAHIQALHSTARQGYEVLLELQHRRNTFWQTPNEVTPYNHLEREIADAWPQLALALRDETVRVTALGVLTQARARDAAPFILSCIRDGGAGKAWATALADGYVELGKVKKPIAEEFAAYLADADAPPAMRAVAFRFCVDLGADARVFEAALAEFCAAHPFSEKILRKRKAEPRVREVLAAQLAAEEKTSLRDGRTVAYSPELGLLARYLAKLGDPHAKELADRYKKFKRWADYTPREDM